MNYIGSKHKLAGFIKAAVYKVVGENLSSKILCDIFAGTGAIGRAFKREVKCVISNDSEYYSFALNKNYIENHEEINDKNDLLAELNKIDPIDNGLIYNNYCYGSGGARQYFSDGNGKKIDTVRQRIEKWKISGEIDDSRYYFLLASLLESADKIANTASVYGAFLKHIKKSAQKELILAPAEFEINENKHKVFREDANKLIRKIDGDILYLDPPYNSRQYGANYHLLNTIALYDNFTPIGKTGLRKYERSKYCQKKFVESEFEDLIKNAEFQYIFLSYNNEGLMPAENIREIMGKYGKYDRRTAEYQRFKSNRAENRSIAADKTIEYLHILEKLN